MNNDLAGINNNIVTQFVVHGQNIADVSLMNSIGYCNNFWSLYEASSDYNHLA